METEMRSAIPYLRDTMTRRTINTVSEDRKSLSQFIWWKIIAGRFDASALHIAHALKQTEIQKSYNKAREKPIDEYLVSIQMNLRL